MSDNYEEFGDEWKKELNKFSKLELIMWIKKLLIEKKQLQEKTDEQ
jgi:hypothetical protein